MEIKIDDTSGIKTISAKHYKTDTLEGNLPQGKQRRHIWQHCITPSRISLMRDDHILFMGWYGFIENLMIIIFLGRCKVILAGRQITKDNDKQYDDTLQHQYIATQNWESKICIQINIQ